jgi:hypothetical protein
VRFFLPLCAVYSCYFLSISISLIPLTGSQVNCIFYFTLFSIAKKETNEEHYPTFYVTSLPTTRSITNLGVNELSHIFSQMTTDDEENAGTLVVLGHELPSSPSSDSSDSAVNAQGGAGPRQDQQQQELVTINAVHGILNAVSVPTNPKRTNSIAHDDWVGHCSVILLVDLEHGGDECGAIQQKNKIGTFEMQN